MHAARTTATTPAAIDGDSLPRVRRYLRFLGCPRHALDDTVQETLLAGLRRWPDGDAPLPFLLATARNQLHKLWRAQTRCREREIADCDHFDELWHRHIDDAGDGMRAALQECLAQLPERSRAVLAMRYGDELDRATIARHIGLQAEGVKSLLARLREGLLRCIRSRT